MLDPALASEPVALMMGERQRTHGDPMVNLSRIAGMWGAYLGKEIGVSDVCAMMTMLKLSRARHSYHRDHFVDAIAYTLLAEDAARP